MKEIRIRHAKESDIPSINKLLYEVNKVHSDARPDLFKPGAKKHSDAELKKIIADDKTPVFVAENEGKILGHIFCIIEQYKNDNLMTDRKTLHIDDLCVDENARGCHVGKTLYEYAVDYAKKNDFYNVTLNVWPDNMNAVKFYEKMGLKVQKMGMEKIL